MVRMWWKSGGLTVEASTRYKRVVPRNEQFDTPHGRCVLVELDDGEPALFGEEEAIAARLGPTRRREFVAGRTALRTALGIDAPIVPDDRGAPVLPAGWVGSIS